MVKRGKKSYDYTECGFDDFILIFKFHLKSLLPIKQSGTLKSLETDDENLKLI